MLLTSLTFIAILAILILVHEFGHFFVAKRSGAKVEEFGIGFPPRVFGLKRNETTYSINLLPIGGFVKIYGEDGQGRKDPRSFAAKSIRTRTSIIAAGVTMNMLLAVLLLSVGHFIGLPHVFDEKAVIDVNVKNINVRVAAVAENSPAEKAGIKTGDIITALQSAEERLVNIQAITAVQDFIDKHRGETVKISLKRGGEVTESEIIPRKNPPEGEGATGIAMLKTGEIAYPFYIAPIKGVESTFLIAGRTFQEFGNILVDLVKTGALHGELSGPVGIAILTGQVQKMGFIFLLQFVALISINLAIINALPLPALDGGRLLFLGVEKIMGRPVNQKYEKISHAIGLAMLIFLMLLVTFRDIGKLL